LVQKLHISLLPAGPFQTDLEGDSAMPASIEEEIKKFAETIWPDYEITIGPHEGPVQSGKVQSDTNAYTLIVRDREHRFVDKVSAGSMEKLRELIEQKLNKG
jgi:hypothetical protein